MERTLSPTSWWCIEHKRVYGWTGLVLKFSIFVHEAKIVISFQCGWGKYPRNTKMSSGYKNVIAIKKKYLTDKIYSRDEKNVIRIKKKKKVRGIQKCPKEKRNPRDKKKYVRWLQKYSQDTKVSSWSKNVQKIKKILGIKKMSEACKNALGIQKCPRDTKMT